MPTPIFPSTEQNLGSEKEINTIDLDSFAERLASVKEAGDKDKMPDWLKDKIEGKASDEETKEEDSMVKQGDDEKGSDKEAQVVATAMEACACGECGECLQRSAPRMASENGKRQIVFTSPDQINAQAIAAARAAGDVDLERAILAARQDVRVAIANRIVETTKEQMEKEQKTAKRKNYRMTVVANAEKAARTASKPAEQPAEGFKSVSAMSADEKRVVAQRFVGQGFPAEYVEAMLGLNQETPLTAEENAIRELMASSLATETKKVALAGLVRTAKLSPEQVERQKRYWKEELGYGDQEWIDDLFTTKYDSE